MNLIEREGTSAIQGLMMKLMMLMMMLLMMLLMSRMNTCLRYNGMPHTDQHMCMVHQIYILIGGWGDHIVKFISCIAANEHEI